MYLTIEMLSYWMARIIGEPALMETACSRSTSVTRRWRYWADVCMHDIPKTCCTGSVCHRAISEPVPCLSRFNKVGLWVMICRRTSTWPCSHEKSRDFATSLFADMGTMCFILPINAMVVWKVSMQPVCIAVLIHSSTHDKSWP